MGLPGRLSTRLQPNHPTDDLLGIAASMLDGLMLGSGDAVIGINPVSYSVDSVTTLLRMIDTARERFRIPTQSCVLAHLTTQMQAMEQGAPLDLLFQSIGGTEGTNTSFGVSMALLAWVTTTVVVIVGHGSIYPVESFRIPRSRTERRETLRKLKFELILGLSMGLIGGLSIGGVIAFGGLIDAVSILLDIEPIGRLFLRLTSGLSIGPIGRLFLGLILGLSMGLIGGLILGLKQDLKLRSRPNQGIWNSLQSTLWTSAVFYAGIIVAVFLFLRAAIKEQTWNNLWDLAPSVVAGILLLGLLIALFLGILVGGGIPCIQHLSLRFVLWQSGIAPWNLAQFLNYCTERRLLQCVGGRYRFLHRELLNHFANSRF